MRNSIVGIIMSIIILFISLIILPMYFIGIIDWRNDMNTIQTATRNFVDKVIDTGQITEDTLSDFNLSIASCSSMYTYTIRREQKVINPDGSGGVISTWIITEDLNNFKQGDLVAVEVTQVSSNMFQRISSMLLGTSYIKRAVKLEGMVR